MHSSSQVLSGIRVSSACGRLLYDSTQSTGGRLLFHRRISALPPRAALLNLRIISNRLPVPSPWRPYTPVQGFRWSRQSSSPCASIVRPASNTCLVFQSAPCEERSPLHGNPFSDAQPSSATPHSLSSNAQFPPEVSQFSCSGHNPPPAIQAEKFRTELLL